MKPTERQDPAPSIQTESNMLPTPFIIGVPRSGTTLLRLMLDAHPDLAIPSETHYMSEVCKLKLGSTDLRKEFVSLLVNYFSWPDLGMSQSDLESAIDKVQPFNLGDGLRSIYRFYAQRHGKVRWGDKTPNYIEIIEHISELLPEAHYVHIIRDGRAVAASMLKMKFNKLGNDYAALGMAWKDKIQKARKTSKSHNYLEISYENLVSNTSIELNRICNFLDLRFDHRMLDYYKTASQRLEEFQPWYRNGRLMSGGDRDYRIHIHRHTSRPPDQDCTESWRGILTKDDIDDIESVAGDLLEELGYL